MAKKRPKTLRNTLIILPILILVSLAVYFGVIQTSIGECLEKEFINIPNADQIGTYSCSNNEQCQNFIESQGIKGNTQCSQNICQLELCAEVK